MRSIAKSRTNHLLPHAELLPFAMKMAADIAEQDKVMITAMRRDWDASGDRTEKNPTTDDTVHFSPCVSAPSLLSTTYLQRCRALHTRACADNPSVFQRHNP